jgi:hypothetical protein
MQSLTRITSLLHRFINSPSSFYAILALFIISAVWIASFSLYPMAFDEEFHYGLIKIYASSLLPYGIEHTSSMAQYGAATADASYLFHYLMSFPYRLFDFIGLSDSAIIILLRYLNIVFVAAAIIIFRRALLLASASPAAATASLAFVSLVPVFVMLTSQINYDNLLLLVTAWCILLTFRITLSLRQKSTITLTDAWLLVCALLIGMSIKYAFLPIALALVLWLVLVGIRHLTPNRKSLLIISNRLIQQWQLMKAQTRVLLTALLLLSAFFGSHYVTNYVGYGSPIPDCDQVFTPDECTAYGPWNRNKMYTAQKSDTFDPLSFPAYMLIEWMPGMTERLTFAVAGKTNGFQTKAPLPIVIIGFIILAAIGSLCLIIQLLRNKATWIWVFTLFLTFIYVGALSYQLYGDYIETAQPVAINGRYLLPLLPLIAFILIQAIRQSIGRVSAPHLSTAAAIVFLVLLVGGGGIGTYIVQSESHWYWTGFAQSQYELLHTVFNALVPFRFAD